MGSGPRDLILYSTQRSGTHFLSSLLASVDNRIVALGEVLHRQGGDRSFVDHLTAGVAHADWSDLEREAAMQRMTPGDVCSGFDSFLEERRATPQTILSVIWMYNQVGRLPDATQAAMFDGRSVVHLVRENILRTHVSDHINRNGLKTAHARGDSGDGDRQLTIELPTAGLRRKLRRRRDEIERQRDALLDVEHIEVTYEELDADATTAIGKVSTTFGLAVGTPRSGLRKSNPQSLRDLLSNSEEVERVLESSPFLPLLDT